MLLNRHATDSVFSQLFPDMIPLLPHQTEKLIHVNISESLTDRSPFPGLSLSSARWFRGEELKPHRESSSISCPGRWALRIHANKHLWLDAVVFYSWVRGFKDYFSSKTRCYNENQQLFFGQWTQSIMYRLTVHAIYCWYIY